MDGDGGEVEKPYTNGFDTSDGEDGDDAKKTRRDEVAEGAETVERPKGGWGTGDWCGGGRSTHSLTHVYSLHSMRRAT